MERILRLAGQLRSAQGQTLAEYVVLVSVIAIVVLMAAVLLGGDISSLFDGAPGRI